MDYMKGLTEMWQPIENAPRDGTWIIAYRPKVDWAIMDTLVIVSYQPYEDVMAWVWPGEPYDVFTEQGRSAAMDAIEDGCFFVSSDFTHWMSIPEAPKELT